LKRDKIIPEITKIYSSFDSSITVTLATNQGYLRHKKLFTSQPAIYKPYKFNILSLRKKETMLTVSCREVGMDCDYVCKGETEEEIMKTAEEHAIRDHGYKPEDLMTPELREKIRSHIKRS
jgi:predicted small metal-binding protein